MPSSLPSPAPGNRLKITDRLGTHAVMAMESADLAEELATELQNRRATPRHGVDENASLLLVIHGSTISCRIVDLSMGGCRLRTIERFTAGSRVCVEVMFKVRGLAFRFSGITQWTDGKHQVGIRFVDVPARRSEELVEALGEVAAENAAKAAEQAARNQAEKEVAIACESSPVPAAYNTREQLPPPDQVLLSAPAIATQANSRQPIKPARRERRDQLRQEVDTSAAIYLVKIASRLSGRIVDLSLSGCRIRTGERFPVGIYTRVETEFRIEGLPFRLGGVVQAIHDRQTVGIRFLDMSSRKHEYLAQLIEDICEIKEHGIPNTENSGMG